ncbi:hypothetical protein K440DRAFT_192286 [Wilcoxina mikolae CBS 423.85]|nr:hypothetical protein K440DRAFT_192286 [Wilcoxina mikolae CBS 423.85]
MTEVEEPYFTSNSKSTVPCAVTPPFTALCIRRNTTMSRRYLPISVLIDTSAASARILSTTAWGMCVLPNVLNGKLEICGGGIDGGYLRITTEARESASDCTISSCCSSSSCNDEWWCEIKNCSRCRKTNQQPKPSPQEIQTTYQMPKQRR